MCRSMVDIQSPTAEIRRGKKKRKKKERRHLCSPQIRSTILALYKLVLKKIEITGQKYNGLPYYIGRP